MVGHLCQSVRQMSDYGVLQRTVTYKLLMGLAASCLAVARPQLLKVPAPSSLRTGTDTPPNGLSRALIITDFQWGARLLRNHDIGKHRIR